MPICLKPSDRLKRKMLNHLWRGKINSESTIKKIGIKSRLDISTTFNVQRLNSQKAAAKTPSHSSFCCASATYNKKPMPNSKRMKITFQKAIHAKDDLRPSFWLRK